MPVREKGLEFQHRGRGLIAASLRETESSFGQGLAEFGKGLF